MKRKITLIPGDGIGPEVAGATVSVIRAAGVQVEWESFVVGAEALSRFGDPLPQDLFDSIKRLDDLPSRTVDALAVALAFGLAYFLHQMNKVGIEAGIPKIL